MSILKLWRLQTTKLQISQVYKGAFLIICSHQNFSGLEHMSKLQEFWANSNEISNWKEVT